MMITTDETSPPSILDTMSDDDSISSVLDEDDKGRLFNLLNESYSSSSPTKEQEQDSSKVGGGGGDDDDDSDDENGGTLSKPQKENKPKDQDENNVDDTDATKEETTASSSSTLKKTKRSSKSRTSCTKSPTRRSNRTSASSSKSKKSQGGPSKSPPRRSSSANPKSPDYRWDRPDSTSSNKSQRKSRSLNSDSNGLSIQSEHRSSRKNRSSLAGSPSRSVHSNDCGLRRWSSADGTRSKSADGRAKRKSEGGKRGVSPRQSKSNLDDSSSSLTSHSSLSSQSSRTRSKSRGKRGNLSREDSQSSLASRSSHRRNLAREDSQSSLASRSGHRRNLTREDSQSSLASRSSHRRKSGGGKRGLAPKQDNTSCSPQRRLTRSKSDSCKNPRRSSSMIKSQEERAPKVPALRRVPSRTKSELGRMYLEAADQQRSSTGGMDHVVRRTSRIQRTHSQGQHMTNSRMTPLRRVMSQSGADGTNRSLRGKRRSIMANYNWESQNHDDDDPKHVPLQRTLSCDGPSIGARRIRRSTLRGGRGNLQRSHSHHDGVVRGQGQGGLEDGSRRGRRSVLQRSQPHRQDDTICSQGGLDDGSRRGRRGISQRSNFQRHEDSEEGQGRPNGSTRRGRRSIFQSSYSQQQQDVLEDSSRRRGSRNLLRETKATSQDEAVEDEDVATRRGRLAVMRQSHVRSTQPDISEQDVNLAEEGSILKGWVALGSKMTMIGQATEGNAQADGIRGWAALGSKMTMMGQATDGNAQADGKLRGWWASMQQGHREDELEAAGVIPGLEGNKTLQEDMDDSSRRMDGSSRAEDRRSALSHIDKDHLPQKSRFSAVSDRLSSRRSPTRKSEGKAGDKSAATEPTGGMMQPGSGARRGRLSYTAAVGGGLSMGSVDSQQESSAVYGQLGSYGSYNPVNRWNSRDHTSNKEDAALSRRRSEQIELDSDDDAKHPFCKKKGAHDDLDDSDPDYFQPKQKMPMLFPTFTGTISTFASAKSA